MICRFVGEKEGEGWKEGSNPFGLASTRDGRCSIGAMFEG